ncbi:MAG: TPM domain-containing protein [Verrucomicrobiae bacterium]|nr:TPM domain-containing protein [Verrucomicrobiae bacterium]
MTFLRGLPLLPALLFFAAKLPAAHVPPPPPQQDFISDFARLLTSQSKDRIKAAQHQAFEQHHAPIIVVTIHSLAEYDAKNTSFEQFVQQWFNDWKIGTLGLNEKGANKGILLFISKDNRRARIELGNDWGRRWDGVAQGIMNGVIIPRFKQGGYADGIADGVEKLAEMAALDPASTPPGPGLFEQLQQTDAAKKVRGLSLFPARIIGWMAGIGALLIMASFFFGEYRKPLLLTGIGLIATALFTYVILVLLAIFLRTRGGTGGGYRGGGFSGGFSGGGGASGSW